MVFDRRFELLKVAREELEKEPGMMIGLIIFINEEGQPRICADAHFSDGLHLSHLLEYLSQTVLDILPTVHSRDVEDVDQEEEDEGDEPENLAGPEQS